MVACNDCGIHEEGYAPVLIGELTDKAYIICDICGDVVFLFPRPRFYPTEPINGGSDRANNFVARGTIIGLAEAKRKEENDEKTNYVG